MSTTPGSGWLGAGALIGAVGASPDDIITAIEELGDTAELVEGEEAR